MRKDAVWKWEASQQKAFEEKKKKLCSAPLLNHFDPFILVQVDASLFGLGAVMAQRMEDGSEKPVSYISRTLSDAERNYTQVFCSKEITLVFVWEHIYNVHWP